MGKLDRGFSSAMGGRLVRRLYGQQTGRLVGSVIGFWWRMKGRNGTDSGIL